MPTAAAELAATLDQWMVGAEPGERSPYTGLTVLDPAATVLTRHQLTRRQTDELAALITDVTNTTSAPWAILAELRRFAGPADQTAATISVDHPGQSPAGTVAFSARAAQHLAELLGYGVTQRGGARLLIAHDSPYQASQRIEVRPDAGGWAAGRTGTISYITVSWPYEPGGQPVLWFHVHLDASDNDLPQVFTVEELAPLSGTAAARPDP
ncbi:MAG: hypothetical protein V7603_5165 [Micromonosporaceae bacterium]